MWRRVARNVAAGLVTLSQSALYAASPLEVRPPVWPVEGQLAYVSKGLHGTETGGYHVYDETASPPGPSAPELPGTNRTKNEPGTPPLPRTPAPGLATFSTPACQPLEIVKVRATYVRLRDTRHRYEKYELGNDWKEWAHPTAEDCLAALKKRSAQTQPTDK